MRYLSVRVILLLASVALLAGPFGIRVATATDTTAADTTAVDTTAADTTAADPAAGLRGMIRHYTLAGHADAAGDLEGVRRHIADGLELVPTSPHLRLGMARAELSLGDTAACLAALEHFAALGTSLDLTAYPPLAGVAALPAFCDLAASLAPVTPPPATVTVVLDDPELWTEGIAWDAATGDLLAGSVKLGKFVRVRDGVQSDLGTSAVDGLMEVIGLDVDVGRRHLWAATGRDRAEPGERHDFGEAPRDNAVVVYDLETGRQVASHARSADADDVIHMWNDVSVAPDGTAYFTDMTTATVWRILPGGGPEVFRELVDLNYVNGLAVGEGGRQLYVVGLEGVVVIDLPGGEPRFLDQPADCCTGLGDGMALRGRHLFIVQNNGLLGMRILHLRLTADGYGVEDWEALVCGLPEGLMAYTCALGDGVLYVNGTAPFGQYDDSQPPPAPVIVELTYGLDE